MADQNLIQQLKEQQDTLVFNTFSRNIALDLGNAIINLAKSKGLNIATEIIFNGIVVFKHSMEGTGLRHDIWLKRKANTVALSLGSSLLFAETLAQDGRTLDGDLYLSYDDYVILGGGFPLIIEGVGIVGSICVSGLPHLDDHGIIVEALQSFLAE
ncbi:MAG: heme-binding protein [bacterium]